MWEFRIFVSLEKSTPLNIWTFIGLPKPLHTEVRSDIYFKGTDDIGIKLRNVANNTKPKILHEVARFSPLELKYTRKRKKRGAELWKKVNLQTVVPLQYNPTWASLESEKKGITKVLKFVTEQVHSQPYFIVEKSREQAVLQQEQVRIEQTRVFVTPVLPVSSSSSPSIITEQRQEFVSYSVESKKAVHVYQFIERTGLLTEFLTARYETLMMNSSSSSSTSSPSSSIPSTSSPSTSIASTPSPSTSIASTSSPSTSSICNNPNSNADDWTRFAQACCSYPKLIQYVAKEMKLNSGNILT